MRQYSVYAVLSVCFTWCMLNLVYAVLGVCCTWTMLFSKKNYRPVWWENGSHHYRATHLSGYVTGLGLSRLCITPSTRLKNLHWTASDTTIQTDLTNHVPVIISSLSFFSLLFLSSIQSTISLRLLPPYAPRNETSIFVASYGSYRVRSLDPGFPPQR